MDEQADGDFVALLTGSDLRRDLCCTQCDREAQAGTPIELVDACEVRSPGIRRRVEPGCLARNPRHPSQHEPDGITRSRVQLPASLASPVDFTAYGNGRASTWLLLTQQHELVVFDPDAETITQPPITVTVPQEEASGRGKPLHTRLHSSYDGTFAAVVNDYGRRGLVVNLTTGQTSSD